MSSPAISISPDVVTGRPVVRAFVQATAVIRFHKSAVYNVSIPIDEVDTLIAELTDARDAYRRAETAIVAKRDGDDEAADHAMGQAKEARCGFGLDGSDCYACETKGDE